MSGRPLIWSSYIYAWADGTPLQHLFGLGPESWEGVFKVYPHNTLVATLYELGWFGVAAMIALWTVMFAAAASARGDRFLLIAAHFAFFLLNMARSEEHTSELQSLMRISYAVFCLKKKNKRITFSITTRTETL